MVLGKFEIVFNESKMLSKKHVQNTKWKISTIQTFAQHNMIRRSVKQVGTPKVLLNVILYMPSLENKLESIALKKQLPSKLRVIGTCKKQLQKISNHTTKTGLATERHYQNKAKLRHWKIK